MTDTTDKMTDTTDKPLRRPGLALGVLAGALALDVSGLGVLNAALPSIGARFRLDDTTLQWVMTAYAVTFAGFLLVGGRLADVLGRRRVFGVGVALFTVSALVGGWLPTSWCCWVRAPPKASAPPCRGRPRWLCSPRRFRPVRRVTEHSVCTRRSAPRASAAGCCWAAY